ncbi:hypothetical protein JVU11DRAFT_11552 [Chiua virens]|nr:hypothetical protein JVU11DRAFT_11552 [Chiua virens]
MSDIHFSNPITALCETNGATVTLLSSAHQLGQARVGSLNFSNSPSLTNGPVPVLLKFQPPQLWSEYPLNPFDLSNTFLTGAPLQDMAADPEPESVVSDFEPIQPLTSPLQPKRRAARTSTSHLTIHSQTSSMQSTLTVEALDDSASSLGLGGVLWKKDLSPQDNTNFNHAFDLLPVVLEILTKIGWESPALRKGAFEYLSQACAESQRHTTWSDDLCRLFINCLQTF